MSLKAFIAALTTTVLTAAPALAVPPPSVPFPTRFPGVPEVSSNGSLAAIVAVAALGMIVWERRRRARAQ